MKRQKLFSDQKISSAEGSVHELKLTFRAIAFVRAKHWRRANAWNVSFKNSLRWPIYIKFALIHNSVDENKFILWHPLQRIITVSLETNPPYKYRGVKNSWETIYSPDLLMTLREIWLALPQIWSAIREIHVSITPVTPHYAGLLFFGIFANDLGRVPRSVPTNLDRILFPLSIVWLVVSLTWPKLS